MLAILRSTRRAIMAGAAVIFMVLCPASRAQNYFVTYSHQMEEPDNLEIATRAVTANPGAGNPYLGSALELEYGVTAWWTSELYLDAQSTARESTLFTGFRLENRFRPLLREHWINPVLYVEFASLNGADKTQLEVVGHDGRGDFIGRNQRQDKKREVELKLILSSNFKGWNVSENFIAEKNLKAFPWEFGYAVAAGRPLSLAATSRNCTFCRENFFAGAEIYGGLGDRYTFGLRDTSHYLAPLIRWNIPHGPALMLSPGFGLNRNSQPVLFRIAVSYEIAQITSRFRRP